MKYSIGLLVLFLSVLSFAHPIKITTSKITISNTDKSITINFFTDDFQAHLSSLFRQQIELSEISKSETELILAYTREHFKLKLNGTETKLTFVSVTPLENNVVQLKLRVQSAATIQKVDLSNTLLLETFDNQSNIVHLYLYGKKQSLQFINGDVRKVVER